MTVCTEQSMAVLFGYGQGWAQEVRPNRLSVFSYYSTTGGPSYLFLPLVFRFLPELSSAFYGAHILRGNQWQPAGECFTLFKCFLTKITQFKNVVINIEMRVFCRSYPDSFIDEHPKTALEVLISFVFFLDCSLYRRLCFKTFHTFTPSKHTAVNLDSLKRFDGLRFTFKCVVFSRFGL